jgi:hypothetical protein
MSKTLFIGLRQMPGGLFVLVAYGAQDVMLTGNPSENFFKHVYRTHVHLAKEPIQNTPVNAFDSPENNRTTESRFKIKRSGDYINEMNLLINLPAIRVPQGSTYQFRWANLPGLAMIEEAKIIIGGTEVQVLDRDRIFSLYKLDYPQEKATIFEKMVGNLPELVDPNNGPYARISSETYPYTTDDDEFSLPGKQLCIPLPFWFSKDTQLSLPVGFLQYHEVELVLKIAPYIQWIQVRETSQDEWIAPPADYDITEYFVTFGRNWGMNPRIECLYYILPDEERIKLAKTEINVPVFRMREYIEYTQRNNFIYNPRATPGQSFVATDTVNFLLRQESNPIRRFILIPRRVDFLDANNWTRLGNWDTIDYARDTSGFVLPYSDRIADNFTFRVNGNPVVEELRADYLGEYDTFKFSHGQGESGLLSYSFGIVNAPIKSTGTVNLGRIREPTITLKTTPVDIAPSVYSVKLLVECVNWFKFQDGYGGLAYST